MMSINDSEVFLWLGAAIVGIFGGILGNLLVSSLFRYRDDLTNEAKKKDFELALIAIFAILILLVGLFCVLFFHG
jgi:hypothetical protein